MLKLEIEREADVNPRMFDALVNACHASTPADAYAILSARFDASKLYWFYRGSHHVAVQSHNHKQRVAIIRDQP